MDCKLARNILVTILLTSLLALCNSSNFDNVVNGFALNLYKNITFGNSFNLGVSPLSVQDSLALTFTGSNGQTTKDLAAGLQFGTANNNQVTKAFHSFLRSIRRLDPNTITLDLVTKFYVREGYRLNNEFKGYACELYTSVESIKFAGSSAAANTIALWVESHTKSTFPTSVFGDSLGSETDLIIVEAVYFTGVWKHQFTFLDHLHFYATDGAGSIIDFMIAKDEFLHGFNTNLDCAIIEIPYNNSDVSMVIFLPNNINQLPKLQSLLTSFDVATMESELTMQEVNLIIPIFNIDYQINLKDTVTKMGMGNIFTDKADFTGVLANHQSLNVAAIVQAVHISVDVNGAEATAVNSHAPISFFANRSFIFMIKKGLDVILVGQFAAPPT